MECHKNISQTHLQKLANEYHLSQWSYGFIKTPGSRAKKQEWQSELCAPIIKSSTIT
jgi:hypothetical protein